MNTAALPPLIDQRPLKRLLHAILGSTLFGLSATTGVRAETPKELHMAEDIELSGFVAGVVLPLDESFSMQRPVETMCVPIATPDGFFMGGDMDGDMDDAAYRAMLDDIQLQQFILVGGIEFQSKE